MKVEILSKDYIKPSSPTPHHLKTHKISLLDQFIPSVYVPLVLYYPTDSETPLQANEEKLRLLKESLSKILTSFYPYAGKVKDSLSIDCNDEGVYFVEAQVDSNLSEFLKHPDLSLIHHLLPSDDISWNESVVGAHVAMVQVTMFKCGGITVGVFVSHLTGDGASLSYFLKTWAATYQKGSCDVRVDFDKIQRVLPQNKLFPKHLSMMGMLYPFLKMGKNVTRRFVFDASALATLKAKAKCTSVENPTRVEVVSALIWKCTIAAFTEKNDGIEKSCLLNHAVDLRRRVEPPYSECKTGNLLFMAIAEHMPETDTKTELGHFVTEIRKAKTKICCDYLQEWDSDEGSNKFCDVAKETREVVLGSAQKGADFLGFSSWNNFGLYDVDFGWGKPMWATTAGSKNTEPSSVYLNFVVLLETRRGTGIEAWVTLDENIISVLESDKQLLEFATLNPSSLKLDMKNV